MNMKNGNIQWMMVVVALLFAHVASANLVLDSVQFDPAIIAAGDTVDIVVQYHDAILPIDEDRIGDPEYKFAVELFPDDSLTREYVIIEDGLGDHVHGVLSGDRYNQVFRVRVLNNAPAGNYEFELQGRWYRNGVPVDWYQKVSFIMLVKKEGIVVDVASVTTEPSVVRPGDDAARLTGFVENVGEKDAKSVEVRLNLPEGMAAAFSDENRVWVGRLNAGESKEMSFFIDVDDSAREGVYNLTYDFSYMDLDDNQYKKSRVLPLRVHSRPDIQVVDVQGDGRAGSSSKLYVTVQNVGEESAEAVDVRIIKQSSQPFDIDVRSDYVGELAPGETGVAIFDLGVHRDADLKEHDLRLLIRAKGDSDENDDRIYTFSRRASLLVTDKATNSLLVAGLVGAVVLMALLMGNMVYRRVRR